MGDIRYLVNLNDYYVAVHPDSYPGICVEIPPFRRVDLHEGGLTEKYINGWEEIKRAIKDDLVVVLTEEEFNDKKLCDKERAANELSLRRMDALWNK